MRTTKNENLDFDDAVHAEVPGKELLEIMTISFNNHVGCNNGSKHFARGILHPYFHDNVDES